jgi:protein involved in polysaccharide export with SLBB domain
MKKTGRYFVLFLSLWICPGFYGFAQEEEITTTKQASNSGASLSAATTDASPNIVLARSNADYRVTPGDVYTLAYSAGSTPVSYTIAVDTSYRIRVSNLGVINGRGKTFLQLRSEVETIVSNNYPLSGVQLVLTQPGVFKVFVKGEVYTAREISAWGLNRLSSLVGGNLTAYASIRDISVKSSSGQTKVYDLFKAQRLGDLNQDPYLLPGDVITFNRIKRIVTISGAVERPGTYQIMERENMKDLIGFYASGFTPAADKTRSTLTRHVGSKEISGDILLLSEQELTGNYQLQHMDEISIPSITSLRPMAHVNRLERTITIDGAVRRPGVYTLMPNENMQELIEVYADGFMPAADKTRSMLTRYVGSKEISGDILLLSEEELSGDYQLQHMDKISIPLITELRPAVHVNRLDRTITLNGAVRRPGIYTLMPNENLKELIEVYADGFEALADKTRSEMIRYMGSKEVTGDIIPLSEDDLAGNYSLQHLDVIRIAPITGW